MIFGFNTDIKHEGTVYHVQSEARQHELLLQTQVFVRGRCIGKHATSYAERVTQPDFSDEQMHGLLKSQHKEVIETIRNGGLERLLGGMTDQPGSPVPPGAAMGAAELKVEWLNATTAYEQGTLRMRFSVGLRRAPVEGALVTARLNVGEAPPAYAQATTTGEGVAEMLMPVEEWALAEAFILVQASHEGQQATHKFRLRRR